ncbi:MAG: aminopeptidase [Nitrososphaerales archaeon]|nr:aminopeptidase [Nitrososphaerales archaeon]
MSAAQLDALYRSVARKMLTETLRVKKGESVTVEAWNNGLGFARHAVAEARAMGCTAVMILEDERAYVNGVRRAPKDSVGLMGKNEYSLLSGTDVYIFIPGQALGVYSRTLKPEELTDSTRYNSSWYEAAEKAGLRGARLVFGYVGRDMARMLGKSVDSIVAGQLRASLVDYGEVAERASTVAARLGDDSEATLDSGGAKLRFRFKGELGVEDGIVDEKDIADGNNVAYLPPGLVTKQVDSESVDGSVRVSRSLTKYGVLAGADLDFSAGQLVRWRSEDKAMLERLLEGVPSEKRRLSLMGIGINPRLKYGFGQDRFVRGSVTLGGLGFTAVLKKGSLSAGGGELVRQGALVPAR